MAEAPERETGEGNTADAERLRQYIQQFQKADSLENMVIKTLESLITKSVEYLQSG